MLETFTHWLDAAGDYGAAVIALVFAVAAVEAAFGLGAFVPAETAVVLAATALADSPLLYAAVIAAAAGAFIGDHLGYAIGGRLGDRTAETAAVRRIGPDRWRAAMRFVEHRGFWIIVVARLLPAVRTLVAAAAGASRMRYARFASATAVASAAWAVLWVLGGAALGSAFLRFAEHAALPALALAAVAVIALVAVRAARRRA
jgi:membrane-associated protein